MARHCQWLRGTVAAGHRNQDQRSNAQSADSRHADQYNDRGMRFRVWNSEKVKT